MFARWGMHSHARGREQQRSPGPPRARHDPAALGALDVLHLQRLIGNQAVNHLVAGRMPRYQSGGRGATLIQRWPEEMNKEVGLWRDSKYRDVQLKLLATGPTYKRFKILNEGPYENTIIYYDFESYRILQPDQAEAIVEGDEIELDLSLVAMPDVQAQTGPETIKIGSPGTGVVAGPSIVKLYTSGLNSCVAWVLYNDIGSYMEHIVVMEPEKVKPDGIRRQVEQIYQDFEKNTGSKATDVYICADEAQPGYKNGWPKWIEELVPEGCDVEKDKGPGSLTWTVSTSKSERKQWKSSGISLEYTG